MNWFWLALSYLIMESVINGVFHIVSKKLKSDEKRGRSILKGVLERLFLVIGLVLGYS